MTALRLETHDVDSDGTADVVFVHGEVADTWGTTVVDALLIAQGKFAAYEWQASDDGGVSEEFLGEAESKKNAKLRKGLKNAMSKFPWE